MKKTKGQDNLISIGDRSTDEQRKIQSSGGVASCEARRRRKALKETMEELLAMPVTDRRRLNKAVKLGFKSSDADNSTLVVIALWDKAIKGDVAAIKELRDMIDETSSETGMLEELINSLRNENDIQQ